MSAARKKVIVRRFGGELQRGYLPAAGLGADPEAELLLPDGRSASVPFLDVKHVAYVKDFNLEDRNDPERIGPRNYSSKPRGGGLWVRLRFQDDDTLEGMVHADIGFLDSLLLDRGLFLDPPDKRGNTQRLFIPRSALVGFEVLGTAGAAFPLRRKEVPSSERQVSLFDSARDE